jgi:hypothetical protein
MNNGKEPAKGTAIVPTIEVDFKDEYKRITDWCAVL